MKQLKIFIAILLICSNIAIANEQISKEVISDINEFERMLLIVAEKEQEPLVNIFLRSTIRVDKSSSIKCSRYLAMLAVLFKSEFNWTVFFSAVNYYYNRNQFLVIFEAVNGEANFSNKKELIKIIFPLKFSYAAAYNKSGKHELIITEAQPLFSKAFFYQYSLSFSKHEKLFKGKAIEKVFEKYLKIITVSK